MANLRPSLSNFIFILLHIGCFIIFPTSRQCPRPKNHRKPHSPASLLRISFTKPKRHKSVTSTWSFNKRIFSSKQKPQITDKNSSVFHQIPSPASSLCSLSFTARPESFTETDYFSLRSEIHPCLNCGEIFQKLDLLEQHQSIKHVVCELLDDDPGKNAVRIIFTTGWPAKNPVIHQVMKIQNSPKILSCFEEYR